MMQSLPFTLQEEILFSKSYKMTKGSITLNWNNLYKGILQNSKCLFLKYFLKNGHWTFTRVTKLFSVFISQRKITYYEAESLSWYSLDLLKQACTPLSRHNRLITPANSGVMTPSSALPAKTNNCRASSWRKQLKERDRWFSISYRIDKSLFNTHTQIYIICYIT